MHWNRLTLEDDDGKYIGIGATLLGIGLFAYQLSKGKTHVSDINNLKPKI